MGPCGPLNLQQWNLDVEAWGTYTPKNGTSTLMSGTSDVGSCGTLTCKSGAFMWNLLEPQLLRVEPQLFYVEPGGTCGTR